MQEVEKLMKIVENSAKMARNQDIMLQVWPDICDGPDCSDPSRYIAALASLNRLTDDQLKIIAESSEKNRCLVTFARECAVSAARMAKEMEGE